MLANTESLKCVQSNVPKFAVPIINWFNPKTAYEVGIIILSLWVRKLKVREVK